MIKKIKVWDGIMHRDGSADYLDIELKVGDIVELGLNYSYQTTTILDILEDKFYGKSKYGVIDYFPYEAILQMVNKDKQNIDYKKYIISQGLQEIGISLKDIEEYLLTPTQFKKFEKFMEGQTCGKIGGIEICYTEDFERFLRNDYKL
jgi:hypothetical protein